MTPALPQEIRVLLADDHFFTRMGLHRLLSIESDLTVVAEAENGVQAVDLYRQHLPDVVILDGSMPQMNGAEAAREIVASEGPGRVVLFSVEETEEDIFRAVDAGVLAYLPKSTPREELLKAVRRVAGGRRYMPTAVQERLRNRSTMASLSEREIEVLKAVAEGHANKVIAMDLGISVETVKTHLARSLGKLGAQDRTDAVVRAIRRGILKPHCM